MKTAEDFVRAVAVQAMGGIMWSPVLYPLMPKDEAEKEKVQAAIIAIVGNVIRSTLGIYGLSVESMIRQMAYREMDGRN